MLTFFSYAWWSSICISSLKNCLRLGVCEILCVLLKRGISVSYITWLSEVKQCWVSSSWCQIPGLGSPVWDLHSLTPLGEPLNCNYPLRVGHLLKVWVFFFNTMPFFNILFYIEVIQLINNIALVSHVQQSGSVLKIGILFQIISHVGCYIILSRVPCAIQQVFVERFVLSLVSVLAVTSVTTLKRVAWYYSSVFPLIYSWCLLALRVAFISAL